MNPQKLAGQCAKLKCCLNFEVDTYAEAVKRMPAKDIKLETADATYFHFKSDVFKREITYSTDKSIPANLVTIDVQRAFEIIAMNKNGEKPLKLQREGDEKQNERPKEFGDIVGQDSLTRFDNKKKKKRKGGNKNNNDQQPSNNAQPNGQDESRRNRHNNDFRRKNNRNRNGERKERNNDEKPNN
jgi:hypothetical protein